MSAGGQPLSVEETERAAQAAVEKHFAAAVAPPIMAGTRRIYLVGGLGVAVLLSAGAFLYWKLSAPPGSPVAPAPAEARTVAPTVRPAAHAVSAPSPAPEAPEAATAPAPAAAPAPAPSDAPRQGFSWPAAEQARKALRYSEALAHYRGLLEQSEKNPGNRRTSGLLHLRVGACLEGLNRLQEARKEFAEAADSSSPIVRAAACYETARMDVSENQYMMGRLRAYQALACLGPIGTRSPLATNSEYLAAHAVTYRALSFYGNDLPKTRHLPPAVDPFGGLSETQLQSVVGEGADRLSAAVLGPQIQSKDGPAGAHLWTAVCAGAPIGDVLSRLATAAGFEIRWEGVDAAARSRPVVLNLSGAGEQQLTEIACGSVGLMARFTGAETVIFDPAACASTSVPRDLAVREAVSLWRRFFLKATDNGQLAAGHFTLAVLYERTGDSGAAMAEFRMVASRYPTDALAPLSLLREASVKIDLRDYSGAREELLDLLNRYPDCPASDEVYLRLGQATIESGHEDEAIATFKKLYFMDLSLASKAGASLGAGKGCFRKKQYDEAAGWLTRRVALVRSPDVDRDLPEAYGLLAKTEAARGHLPAAVSAYKQALAIAPRDSWRAEMLLDLVHILVQQEDFVGAMALLEGLSPKEAAPPQADEILLARAEILAAMRLPEQAMSLLRRALPACSSPETHARMTLQLARAMVDCGDANLARETLCELLPKMEPGALAHRTALDLAEVCVRSEHNAQAITVCRELLKSPCSEEVRRSARAILGRAYVREKDYQRAAMALSGMPLDARGAAKP
jgi:tetratricopeptide (TPR) repeat protein